MNMMISYQELVRTFPNTVRNRNVLSTVRLGMEVLRHSGYTITREDLLVAATLLAQNLFTHGYALGKL
uniref:IS4 family transposase n=1 Tax=Providencia rettgeri TaxID=587 RepID=A0A220DI66_PRORE|nr:hypothetical protein PRE36_0000004643 [Providencia rettgeri]